MVTAATIARRFYLEGRSKIEIADELGISRFQVARMLEEAQRLGLVRVSIELPSHLDADLSDRLQQRLGLRRVIVVSGGDQPQPADQLRQAIGAVTAELLAELVEPEMTLGVACSRTIVQMTEQVDQLAPCTVVQISGTMAGTDPEMGGVEIVVPAGPGRGRAGASGVRAAAGARRHGGGRAAYRVRDRPDLRPL